MAANLVIPLREEKQLVEAITNTPWMWRRALSAATREVEDDDSWEVRAFAEDAGGLLGGTWPPRSYSCTFCRREFRSAQALGGHMNVHRRDRARLRQSSPGGIPPETAASFPSPVMVPGAQDQFPAGLCFLYPLPAGNSNSDNTLLYPVAHNPCNSMNNNTSVMSPPPQMLNPAGCTVNSDRHHHPQLQSSFPYRNYNSNLTAFIPTQQSSSPHNSSPSAHQPSTVLSISPYSPSDALPSVHLPAANIHRSNSSDSAEISDVLAGSSSGGCLPKGEGAMVKWSHAGAFQPYSPVSNSFKDQNGYQDHIAAYHENQKKMRLDQTVEEYSEDDGDDDDDDLDLELRLGQRAA